MDIPALTLLIEILTSIASIQSSGIETISPNTAIVEDVCQNHKAPENLNCAVDVIEALEPPEQAPVAQETN